MQWREHERVHIDRLDQRRQWLEARIRAKRSVGWDVEYDISERDALAWVIRHVHEQSGHDGR